MRQFYKTTNYQYGNYKEDENNTVAAAKKNLLKVGRKDVDKPTAFMATC
jgi:hypothetical protein